MEQNKDIRWIQRFANYRKALFRMKEAVEIVKTKMNVDDKVDDLLQEGLIQRFEYTHELAWKVMKDYAEYHGYNEITGSRDAIRKALEIGIIDDKQWMESIIDRNLTSHNYDDVVADSISKRIIEIYFPLFIQLENKLLPLSEIEPTLF